MDIAENGDIWLRTADMIDVNADAATAYSRHCIEGKVDETGKLIYNDEEMTALHNIINTCKEIGATPILVTAPYLSEYVNAIYIGSPKFFDEFYEWMDSVVQPENVEYYDYCGDERFCNRYDLFMNTDYLNKEGARKFTDILIEDVSNQLKKG